MKIQGVTTYIRNATGWRNWLYVRIDTDEGIHGIGEAFCTGPDKALEELIRYFGTWLINEDPNNTEKIRQKILQYSRFPAGQLINTAASAIDIALWDIKGKALGQPIYKLLGGPVRDKVWVYCHAMGKTPEQGAENLRQKVEKYGYNCAKIGAMGVYGAPPQPENLREIDALFACYRNTFGEDFNLCTDLASKYYAGVDALAAVRAMAPYRLFFAEEPVRPENFEEVAALAEQFRALRVPLAAGEQIMNMSDWRRFLEARCAEIVQPDLLLVGGLTGMKKLDAMCGPYYRKIAMHAARGPVANAANVHCAMTMPNFLILEHEPVEEGIPAAMVTDQLITRDGYTRPNEKPGLGLDFDYDYFNKMPQYVEWNFAQVTPGKPETGLRDPDGGIHVV